MVVAFSQFGQIKAGKDLQRGHRVSNGSVQAGWQQTIHLIAVMLRGMLQPLFAMGHGLTPLVKGDQGVLRQVIEQGSGLTPGQPHEATHPLRRVPRQQLLHRFCIEQLLELIREIRAQSIRH